MEKLISIPSASAGTRLHSSAGVSPAVNFTRLHDGRELKGALERFVSHVWRIFGVVCVCLSDVLWDCVDKINSGHYSPAI